MKQAIQEGFILDVLQNYTTVQSYYRLVKKVEDDPEFDTKRAQKKLRHYVESHGQAIREKAEIMVDHFKMRVRIDDQFKVLHPEAELGDAGRNERRRLRRAPSIRISPLLGRNQDRRQARYADIVGVAIDLKRLLRQVPGLTGLTGDRWIGLDRRRQTCG